MEQIPVSLWTLIAGILVSGISIWVGQNYAILLPVQASAQAPLVDSFFGIMLTIATALFLVVQGAILIFFLKYRQREGDDRDGMPIEGNFALEIFWTAIPSIIVIILGIYSVDVYTQMGGLGVGGHNHKMVDSSMSLNQGVGTALAATLSDSDVEVPEVPEVPTEVPQASTEEVLTQELTEAPTELSIESPVELPVESPVEPKPFLEAPAVIPVKAPSIIPQQKIGIGANPQEQGKNADLLVNITGMQFAWIFNYPDSDITSGELHVPVGADVQLNIAATDVIHSFWVPQFRLKQDAIPGQTTELRFVATKPGTYPIVCAELCGGYHGSMRSQVIVHTQDDFDEWLETNRIASAKQQVVAIKTSDLSKSDYLAPYAKVMGVD
jgi:cytochrome c oxidase subunit II